MAPKASFVVNTPTEESVKDSEGLPWLDGDDMHVPLFLATLDRYLQSEHPNLYAFIENNFTVDRSYTITWTAEQAIQIAAGRNADHSFTEPPAPLPVTDTALSDGLKDRFKVQPDTLRTLNRTLQGVITARVERGTAAELKKGLKADGLGMLKALHKRHKDKSVEIDSALDVHFQSVVAGGISDATVASFNEYYTALTLWNDAKTEDNRAKGPKLSTIIADAVRELGTSIETQLDIKLGRVTDDEARNPETVVAICRTVIRNKSAKDVRLQASGKALAAVSKGGAGEEEKKRKKKDKKDPDKDKKARADRGPWEAKYGKCRHCGELGHWNSDCPNKPDKPLGCYVDDLCCCASHTDEHSLYHDFITKLQSRWEVEDEGELTDLLNVEFTFGDDHVKLSQTAYIEKMVSTYLPDGIPLSGKHCSLPCDESLPRHAVDALSQDATSVDPALLKQYQSLVGALLYCATQTRPDVAFAVGYLCRAMGKPTSAMLAEAVRVLCYLHRTRHLGLTFSPDQRDVEGYSDSDWGVKHSTTGYVFRFSSAAISWGSKKQTSVALSSCEAEIMAASEAAKEAVFLAGYLDELDERESSVPVELAVDNTGARDLAYNPEHHSKSKHIERRHFFVREMVEEMRLRVPYVNTVDNLADFFTKPLPPKQFTLMRDTIMNVPFSERMQP